MIGAATRTRLLELAAASPLIFWLGLGIIGSTSRISRIEPAWGSVFAIGSQIATILLLAFVIIFLIIRRPAIRKAPGLAPRLAGIAGCVLPSFIALLPRAEVSPAIAAFSAAAVLLGTIMAIFAVLFLGRSFSVMPQARGLATEGPYRIVRHPLYLAELTVLFGATWEIRQPWPVIVLVCAIGVQVIRMHFEEKILSETFPSYRQYVMNTARLFPGIY
ncbi:isoprenylcysteine carboxylmethyltransferase family protein [Methylocystis sp. 9N]|uniref:Isoprenylcysteine carboxylmethyltransferase family protein n=1 Tax=Methylocystis borbori TaxID=3118750 RepID=A0ABU7XC68_9HYPH